MPIPGIDVLTRCVRFSCDIDPSINTFNPVYGEIESIFVSRYQIRFIIRRLVRQSFVAVLTIADIQGELGHAIGADHAPA